jgi:CheY-like chemotaxis protein
MADALAHSKSIRALVVDDEPNHRRCLALGLRLEGFTVAEAADAAAALAQLAGAPFDVAVVDVMMPGINGLELARRLRADYPRLRVVLMSAYHLTDQQVERANLGVVGFVPKPYRLEELTQMLRTAVAEHSSSQPPPLVPASSAA